jgi:type II secretory pathway component PulM
MANGNRTQTVQLGCGTLILIALIVLFFSQPGLDAVESTLSGLRKSVDDIRATSQTQTSEIRDLRRAVEDLRKGGAAKDK